MEYKLAKELKDAGFPQADPNQAFNVGTFQYIGDNSNKETLCYIPTLSELIEACGDKFDALGKCKDDGMSKIVDGWIAVDEDNKRRWGKTPEEAVANLWLALNKK